MKDTLFPYSSTTINFHQTNSKPQTLATSGEFNTPSFFLSGGIYS